jgi:hypothetical protein
MTHSAGVSAPSAKRGHCGGQLFRSQALHRSAQFTFTRAVVAAVLQLIEQAPSDSAARCRVMGDCSRSEQSLGKAKTNVCLDPVQGLLHAGKARQGYATCPVHVVAGLKLHRSSLVIAVTLLLRPKQWPCNTDADASTRSGAPVPPSLGQLRRVCCAAVRIRVASLDVMEELEQAFRDTLERRLRDCDIRWCTRDSPAPPGTATLFLHQPEQRLDAPRLARSLQELRELDALSSWPGAVSTMRCGSTQ